MIRRLPAASVAAVALASLMLMSGCNTVSENRSAAVANDHELSVDDFTAALESIGGQSNPSQVVDGEVSGEFARTMLTEWVHSALLTDVLETKGLVIDDSTRSTAADHIQQQNPTEWGALTPAGQQFLVDIQAPLELVNASGQFVSEDEVRAAYEAGATRSGLFCLRVMVAADQATASDIEAQLGSGADFATLANQYPIDAQNPNGGIFLDPTTQTDCTATTTLADQYAQVVASTPIGRSTDPIDVSGSFVFFLQRPYDEVADDVRAKLGPSISSAAVAQLTAGQAARVDSRYGTWDPDAGKVVSVR